MVKPEAAKRGLRACPQRNLKCRGPEMSNFDQLTSLSSTVTEKLFSSKDTSEAVDPLWTPFTINIVLPANQSGNSHH